MKRLLVLSLLLLSLTVCAAAGNSFTGAEDITGRLVFPYSEEDPDGPACVWSYCYPRLEESDGAASDINQFFLDKEEYDLEFEASIQASAYASVGQSVKVTTTWSPYCNNGNYYSVLLCRECDTGSSVYRSYTGCNFRITDVPSAVFVNLPALLGTVSTGEKDEWLQDRQTEKADSLVREMVFDYLEDNEEGWPLWDDLSMEDLEAVFFPEEDFVLDDNGDPVFFIQPGVAAPEEAGPLFITIPLEDILDEL